MHQKNVRAHQDGIAALKRETVELALRNEQNGKHITEVRVVFDACFSSVLTSDANSSTLSSPTVSLRPSPRSLRASGSRSRSRASTGNSRSPRSTARRTRTTL